jgi:hypothetical protein
MTDHGRTKRLWAQFMSGPVLTPEDAGVLLRALQENEELRKELLEDLQFDGLLQIVERPSQKEEDFEAAFWTFVAAKGNATQFIRSVESKLPAETGFPRSSADAGMDRMTATPKRSPLSTRRTSRRTGNSASSSWVWGVVAAGALVVVGLLFALGAFEPDPPAREKAGRAPEHALTDSEARRKAEQGQLGRERAQAERDERERVEALAALESKRLTAEARLREIEEKRRQMAQRKPEPTEDQKTAEKREQDLAELKREKDRIEQDLRESAALAKKAGRPGQKEEPREENPQPKPPAEGASPPAGTQVAIRVEEVSGEATRVTKEGKTPLVAGAEVFPAEGLETGGDTSRIVLRFPDKTRVDLGPATSVTEIKTEPGKRLTLTQGTLRAVVAKQPIDHPMILQTPHGEARVVGTTLRILIDPDPAKGTRLEVDEGKVELGDPAGRTVSVESGHYAVAADGIGLVAKPISFWDGALAVYRFHEGEGAKVHDVSRRGSPLDLKIDNLSSVRWLPTGLAIVAPTVVASAGPARKIIDASKTTNELSFEVWMRPSTLTQSQGDARIVTLSADPGNQNFLLGQDGANGPPNSYVVRFRTTATNSIGKPQMDSPGGTAALRRTQVVYSRSRSGVAILYLDGQEVARAGSPGNLSTWNDGYRLALGNEFVEGRAWLGEYQLVAIYGRVLSPEEVKQHYRAGTE